MNPANVREGFAKILPVLQKTMKAFAEQTGKSHESAAHQTVAAVTNCLLSFAYRKAPNNATHVYHFVQLPEEDVQKTPQFGKKAIGYLKRRMEESGLEFGMRFTETELQLIREEVSLEELGIITSKRRRQSITGHQTDSLRHVHIMLEKLDELYASCRFLLDPEMLDGSNAQVLFEQIELWAGRLFTGIQKRNMEYHTLIGSDNTD